MKNLRGVLQSQGIGFANVVKATVHLQDLNRDFRDFDAVYRQYVSEPYPVRTTVGSNLFGILVEIDVVAVLSELAVAAEPGCTGEIPEFVSL